MNKFLLKLISRKRQVLLVFLIFPISLLSYATNGQKQVLEKRISITIYNKPLKQVLEKISTVSSVGIVFSNTEDLKTLVSIDAKKEPLHQILDEAFAGLQFTYQVIDDKIVISHHDKIPDNNKPGKKKISLKGIVSNQQGQPLSGATIKIKDGILLAITDKNGEFTLRNIDAEVTLQFFYTGYQTKSLTLIDDSTYLNVVLQSSTNELNEVKIISNGYQQISPERATGSYTQPIKEMYDDRVSTDVISKLDGITSGLLFNRNTTNTQNGQPDLSIRGRSTIFANDQPLIVVDNFPYSGDINNINPNDVQNITVLKDAAAASIWGVRAGNGVIVITTKKGRLNQPLNVSLNSNVTVVAKPNLAYNPNYMSSSDYIDVEQFLFNNGKYDSDLNNTTTYPAISSVVNIISQERNGTISSSDATAQINALRNNNLINNVSKYLYQDAVNQQYSLTLNGGDDKTTYYISTGYDNNLQSQRDNNYNRLTLNSNISITPIKNLFFTIGLNYIQSNTKTDNTISNTLTGKITPYSLLEDGNGNHLSVIQNLSTGFIQSAQSMGYLDWSYIPLDDLGLAANTSKFSDIRISPSIKYTLMKGLSIDGKYQYEQYTTDSRNYESQQTYYARNLINEYASTDDNGNVTGFNIPLGGMLAQSLTTVTDYNARGQINYNGTWDKSALNAIAGIEQSQTTTNGSSNSNLYGYDDNTGNFSNVDLLNSFQLNPHVGYATIPNGAGITGLLTRLRSYFANLAYTYLDKYTFSASGRIDGSNYFGVATNLKSVPLWSVGGKWDINKESFYHIDWLPELHVRATYGYNGNLNQNITGVTTFMYNQVNSYYTGLTQANISNIGDPELRWEKAGIGNLGLDFALKNNILSGSLEYYKKNGSDIIGNESVAPSTGLQTFEGNFAGTTGNGFDLQLTTKNLNKSVLWNTTLLFSHATDKVTKYNAPIIASALTTADGASGNTYPLVGYPVYGVWSYKWAGLDPTNGDPQGYINGKVSKDYATLTNPTSAGDLVYSGPARPQYFGGLNNRFAYKDFSFSFNVSYKFDYYFRRSSLNYASLFTSWLGGNKEFAQRWQKLGDEKTTNVPSMVYPDNQSRDQFYQYSQATVVKGDNIRLQDLSLSYNFNKKEYKNLPFNNIQIFTYANNLGIIWRANKLHLDPDNPTGYPVPKSISFGLKTNF